MRRAAKIFLFCLAAWLTLEIGLSGANRIWRSQHARYSNPETGYFRGNVSGRFENDQAIYSLQFSGESPSRWYSTSPTNFVYTQLDVEMYADGQTERLVVHLPSLQFRSGRTNGTLTAEYLRQFLLKGQKDGTGEMGSLINHFKAAGEGRLPAPRHHTHKLENPAGTISHFQSGRGFGWIHYTWIKIWIVLVVCFAWWLTRKLHPTARAAIPSKA